MTMYFPSEVVVNQGGAYTFLLYSIQVAWTLLAGAVCMGFDRSALGALEEASVAQEQPQGQPIAADD
jgi:hypothetical protein